MATTPLPRVSSWDELEDLTWEIYARQWQDPHAQRHGRNGQRQHGVDIYGQPKALGGRCAGIQCKDAGHLTIDEIKTEVTKAKDFRPGLAEYLITTTAPRDARVQEGVRLLNERRKRQGKFPVHVAFWEDIASFLKHPDHRDLLRKYYAEWQQFFDEGQEHTIRHLVTEREAVLLELADARAQGLQERWEALRVEANSGYHEAVRPKAEALATDLERIGQVIALPDELKDRVYRLAANVFLPHLPGGNAQRAQQYLGLARQFSTGHALTQCRLMEALIALVAEGPVGGLATLADVTGDEADRLRFSLQMEAEQLEACAAWLAAQDQVRLLNSPDWARPLAFYAAVQGDAQRMEAALDRLLAGPATADHLMVAGQACVRVAQHALLAFCQEHGVSPTFHLADLSLEALVEGPLERRAAGYFREAAGLFEGHGCPTEAQHALELAARLQLEASAGEAHETLPRLGRLAPHHPLVVARGPQWIELPDKEKLAQIVTWLETPRLDLALVLQSIQQLKPSKTLARRLIKLLQDHAARFAASDDTYAFCLATLVELRSHTPTTATRVAWLEQLDPPRRYAHLATLLPAIYFYGRRQPDPAARWVERALATHPEHPEVLAVATRVFRARGEHGRQLECARRLRGLLRTSQTVTLELEALQDDRDFDGFIAVAEQATDLALPEAAVHAGGAQAALQAGRLLDAQAHLEWLRANGRAGLTLFIQLAEVYHKLGQAERALEALHECVRQHPTDPAGYLALSELYLATGHPTDSFDWALRARRRFPEDARVAFHFGLNCFWTGFERREDTALALREFRPGGRFAGTHAMAEAGLAEMMELLRARGEQLEALEGLYRRSQLPALLLCYGQSPAQPYAGFHAGGLRHRRPRYAANGAQTDHAEWLARRRPQAVVLDYSALLSLRSLYGHAWVDRVRARFNGAWTSSRLLDLLIWEEAELAQTGQPARQVARRAILDAIRLPGPAVRVHSPPDAGSAPLPPQREPGQEMSLAARLGVPCLHAYLREEERRAAMEAGVPVVGLVLLANALEGAGEIDRPVREALLRRAGPREPAPSGTPSVAMNGGLAAHPLTLIEIAMAGALPALVRHCGTLHLAESAWRWLEQESADFEHLEQVRQELRDLHRELGQAIREGVVHLGVTPMAERRLVPNGGAAEVPLLQDDPPAFGLAYLEDLLHLAHTQDLPLWTDDRWTSEVRTGAHRPPLAFGTDSFLELQRRLGATPDEVFPDYERLVEWQYRGLPFNAD